MFKYFHNKEFPISIDFGGYSLKMVQMERGEKAVKLLAAAKAYVPDELRNDPAELREWRVAKIKEFLVTRPFRGKKVVTCLPARDLIIQHLRLPKMKPDELKKSLPWIAQEELAFDLGGAMLRHIDAGEVYESDQRKMEVILMAAPRAMIRQYLSIIEQAKLEIVSINVEAFALVGAFGHLKLSDNGQDQAVMMVDMGHTGSRVVITHNTDVTFWRNMDISSDEMKKVIAKDNDDITVIDDQALTQLVNEIRNCIRYHDLMFTNYPVGRVIFVGGQAQNKQLCQKLAQNLGLPAQLGDPMAGIDPNYRTGPHSDLNSDQSNCDWTIAYGMGMGVNNTN